jgi:predicted ATPase
MKSPTRIYLVGAHATGKTTLARWIRDRYGLPMISEVARGVLAEMEAQLESLRTNLELVNEYQAQVFERQLEMEALANRDIGKTGGFVSDRAFCNLAYAAHHSTILSEIMNDPRLASYMESVKQGVVFYLRPHRDLVVSDGVRAGLEWEEVVRIDGMVKLLLEMFAVPYVPVDCLPMQERTRLVERVLSLTGLRGSGSKNYLTSPGLNIAVESHSDGLASRGLTPAGPRKTAAAAGRSGNGSANGASNGKETANGVG